MMTKDVCRDNKHEVKLAQNLWREMFRNNPQMYERQ